MCVCAFLMCTRHGMRCDAYTHTYTRTHIQTHEHTYTHYIINCDSCAAAALVSAWRGANNHRNLNNISFIHWCTAVVSVPIGCSSVFGGTRPEPTNAAHAHTHSPNAHTKDDLRFERSINGAHTIAAQKAQPANCTQCARVLALRICVCVYVYVCLAAVIVYLRTSSWHRVRKGVISSSLRVYMYIWSHMCSTDGRMQYRDMHALVRTFLPSCRPTLVCRLDQIEMYERACVCMPIVCTLNKTPPSACARCNTEAHVCGNRFGTIVFIWMFNTVDRTCASHQFDKIRHVYYIFMCT